MKKEVNRSFAGASFFLFFALLLAFAESGFAQSLPVEPQSRLATGIQLYSQGRWRDAVLELRRVQAEAPTRELRAEALFWISMAELSAGEYEEALRDMDVLQETDPGNRWLQELPYHRGRALYHLGRFNEAIVLLKGYADSILPGPGGFLNSADASRKAAALYWTGECLFSMGQLDMASDIFRIVTEEFPGNTKYEASMYRIALINQKKVETELLELLKLSHEESLRNMEEFRRREISYDQALGAYQRRIADMLRDSRFQELEESNARYQEQLGLAEERIRLLENSLTVERLNTLRESASELEERIRGNSR
jgi:tetratricopeptide (TPR) repeat protein